jgi:uncharacterized protein with von Willebrand factor type A (vWA) domain
VAQPASQHETADGEDVPSLDPHAIERNYRRERARRRARVDRRTAVRSSNARFWVVLSVLVLMTVCLLLVAWREVQSTFGL